MPRSKPAPATARVTTKGQVLLPKAIREKRRWNPGTRLVVEDTPEGVLLKPVPFFPPTRPEDVFGMVKYDGPPVSINDMNKAILTEAERHYARTRY